MTPILILLLALLSAGAVAVTHHRRRHLRGLWAVNALDVGTHNSGRITRTADAAVTSRYLIAKAGATATSFALATASDRPLAIIGDEPAQGEHAVLALLGVTPGTLVARTGAAIAVDKDLSVNASGQVIELPSSAGTYWVIGRSLTVASGAGELVEIQHCYPIRLTIS